MTFSAPKHIVLVFVDGFGWGEVDPRTNPQQACAADLLRLPPVPPAGAVVDLARGGRAVALDAVLGVEGEPQSATGQVSLLTGRNAQASLGRHLAGFPNEALREILLSDSVLKQLSDRGVPAGFLNAFRPPFQYLARQTQLRLSATTVANLAADLPFHTLNDLLDGRSICQDVTNASLRRMGYDVPLRSPTEAGRILGQRAADYGFLLFEYFQSDRAGHLGDLQRGCGQMDILNAFFESLLDTVPDGALVLLCSDHGNLEDATTRRHTTNPVPLMAWGTGAEEFVAGKTVLTDVTPAIVEFLTAG